MTVIFLFVRSGFLAGFLAFKSASKSRLQIVRSLIFSSGGSCALIFFEEARGDFFAILRMLLSVCLLETLGLPDRFPDDICSEGSFDLEQCISVLHLEKNLQFLLIAR